MSGARDFLVCKVTPTGTPDEWDVAIGPEDGDPWLTVTRSQLGREPKVGETIRVVPPHVVSDHGIVRGNIDSLIAAMPCLVRKGPPPFGRDSSTWRAWIRAGCLSSGELAAAQFVLHVWNPHTNAKDRKPYRFDFAEAMNVWDHPHLEVFAAWARSPWYV